MNIDKVLKKYTEFYSGKSYSYIADRILESELSIKATFKHRTLRKKISEYLRNNLSTSLEKEVEFIRPYTNPEEIKSINWADEVKSPSIDSYHINADRAFGEYSKPLVIWNSQSSNFNIIKNTSTEIKSWIVIGCIHFPFHNKPFWNATLKLIEYLVSENKLAGIILNGDVIDAHSLSRHNKGKITIPGLTMSEEYRLTNIELDRLDRILTSDVQKHYLYGNHEMWYSQYMSETDSHKLGTDVVKSPKEALRLAERGFIVQENYKTAHVILGDTEVHHGTYVNKHAAAKHGETMRRSNVFNHTHRTGSYLEGNMYSYNLGWMGDKDQPVFSYMDRIQKETWTNGFGKIDIDSDNISHVQQITWKNNKFIYNGKVYK